MWISAAQALCTKRRGRPGLVSSGGAPPRRDVSWRGRGGPRGGLRDGRDAHPGGADRRTHRWRPRRGALRPRAPRTAQLTINCRMAELQNGRVWVVGFLVQSEIESEILKS